MPRKPLYDVRRAAGLCVDCGKPKHAPFVRCRWCLIRIREAVNLHDFRMREKLRMAKASTERS
jgi:hypothetical protein